LIQDEAATVPGTAQAAAAAAAAATSHHAGATATIRSATDGKTNHAATDQQSAKRSVGTFEKSKYHVPW